MATREHEQRFQDGLAVKTPDQDGTIAMPSQPLTFRGSSAPRGKRLVAAAVAVVVLMVMWVGAVTTAEAGKMVDSFIGNPTSSTGNTGGLFNQPRGVAVNNSTGDIYVVDGNNHRIQQFDAAGNFIRAFGRDVLIGGVTGAEVCTVAATCKNGTTGALGGEFNSPQGIAVDQSTSALYVSDQNNLRIQKFDASGAFVLAFGRDVVSGNPETGFEVCSDAALCKAGTSGALGGEFASTFNGHPVVAPIGAPNAGNLLIADPGNRRVQEITSAGVFVRTFGYDVVQPGGVGEQLGPSINERQTVTLSGFLGGVTGGTFTLTLDGQTTAPIAFDATALDVEVALEGLSNVGDGDAAVSWGPGPNTAWVVEFVGALAGTDVSQMAADASGLLPAFLSSASVSTTQPGGPSPLLEACTVASECKAGVAGSGVGQFGTNSPTRVAVGLDGSVYTVESIGNSRVQKFSPDAGPVGLSPSSFGLGVLPGGSSGPGEVAVDSVTGRVFVTKAISNSVVPGGTEVVDALQCPGTATDGGASEQRIYELTTAGAAHDTHMVCGRITSVAGLAYRPSSGRLFVSSQTGGHRVYVLDADGATPAIASTTGASNVSAVSATLHGQVNSNGQLPTSYRLEVSSNGTEWSPVSSGSVPAGTTSVAVSGIATDLLPNTSYRVRVMTNKGFGNADVSSVEAVFLTDAIPPSVASVRAVGIDDVTAGLVALINPHSTSTTYVFEYGVGHLGNRVPVPDASVGDGPRYVSVRQDLTDLEPNTTYQFRVVARSSTEGTTVSPTETFTTRVEARPREERAYELVSPPYKESGIGVGYIYTGLVIWLSLAFGCDFGVGFG